MIVIHDGKDQNGNINKTMLIESKSIATQNISIEELSKIIKAKINLLYKYKNLILIGDGARWMKHLASLLDAHFVLDTFHWKKRVRDTIGYQKYKTKNKILFEKYEKLYYKTINKMVDDFIETNQIENAIKFLKQFIEIHNQKISKNKINEIRKLIRYLKTNKTGLSHFDKPWYIGSRTEAFIANWIKRPWKLKNSTFNFETFQFLLKRNESKTLKYIFI